MNHLLDTDPEEDSAPAADREISLGLPTILGLFFALALVCAGFFGYGYSLGRKSAQAAADAALQQAESTPPITVKPMPGSVADQPATPSPQPADDNPQPATAPPTPAASVPSAPRQATVALGPSTSTTTPAVPAKPTASSAAPPAGNGPQPATGNQQPATSPTGSFMVQIAAVSTQEIADIELTALKKYGYDVVVRHEPQDQLLHIQVGPYSSRKDAEAMRQNILAHGFNAIVK